MFSSTQFDLSVLVSVGNNKLGGQDFSQRLFQYTSERVRQQYGVAPTLKEDVHRLRQAVEAAKLRLTVEPQVSLKVPLRLQITEAEGPQEKQVMFQAELSRELFEEIGRASCRERVSSPC